MWNQKMQLTHKPKALLFDLDGTLAHTLPQLSIAASKVAQKLGVDTPSAELMATYVGNGVAMLLGRIILGRHDITIDEVPEDKLKEAKALFEVYYTEGLHENFEVYAGVKEGIEYFHSIGIKLGVVTNKPHVFAEPLIKYMGLDKYMGAVLGGEVLSERKPNPAPLYYVLEKLGVDAKDAAMVGDSINDVRAGENASMPTIAFTYGYDGGYDLKTDCSPDYLFDSFVQLTELIKSLPDAS